MKRHHGVVSAPQSRLAPSIHVECRAVASLAGHNKGGSGCDPFPLFFLNLGKVMWRRSRFCAGSNLPATASFFRNRFAGIPCSKILSWWAYFMLFMLNESLPIKLIFPIDTVF